MVWLGACAGIPPQAQQSAAHPRGATPEQLKAPIYVRDVGFETPESALHDPESDLYLVSNIAGGALEADDHAFISRVRPDGSMESLRWIDSASPDVELDAPKGMLLADDVLYVADIHRVRKFDSRSGKPLGSVVVPGASFLNDLCSDGSGGLYVSDSGLGPGYTPSGNDAVHHISKSGAVRPLARSRELGGPSGLLCEQGSLWVASFGGGELYRLDAHGERSDIAAPALGSLDGLARFQGKLYVSSWQGALVYELRDGTFIERIPGLDAPGDLAVDEKRGRLLVTHYNENALSIHQL